MYALSQARRALAAVDLRQGLAVSEVRDRLVQGLRLRETGQRILAFYLHEMEDLAALAVAQAGAEGFQLDASAGERLAVSARGTPRELLRLLDRVLDEPQRGAIGAWTGTPWSRASRAWATTTTGSTPWSSATSPCCTRVAALCRWGASLACSGPAPGP